MIALILGEHVLGGDRLSLNARGKLHRAAPGEQLAAGDRLSLNARGKLHRAAPGEQLAAVAAEDLRTPIVVFFDPALPMVRNATEEEMENL